jgi:hypothetical protein
MLQIIVDMPTLSPKNQSNTFMLSEKAACVLSRLPSSARGAIVRKGSGSW